jgi:microsomal dipeptidase-like Zn-dependent dipeptidase
VISSPEDFEGAIRSKKSGIILAIEGGRPVAGPYDISQNLRHFRSLGLSSFQPVWEESNPSFEFVCNKCMTVQGLEFVCDHKCMTVRGLDAIAASSVERLAVDLSQLGTV